MSALVRSTSGRNMWAIMRFFKVLPNNPLLKALTFSQREFIIQSMNEDVKEQERAAKGMKTVAQVEDKSFEKKFYSNDEVDLLEPGDDLDKIYKQSLEMKAKEDAKRGVHEDYDKVLTDKIESAAQEKRDNIKRVKNQVEENWRQLEKESKDYYTDDE